LPTQKAQTLVVRVLVPKTYKVCESADIFAHFSARIAKMRTRLLGLLLLAAPVWGGVITYSDRGTFDGQGTIAFNSNFQDFGTGFSYPSNPFTRGDVTYTNTENLVIGPDGSYSIGRSQNVITNNYWTPLTGNIATGPQYTLFGFDVAVTSGSVDVAVYTNSGTYVWSNLTIPDGNPDFAFQGFEATAGEYFTGFRIDSRGASYLPGMTNVALGNAGPSSVPEPGSFLLLGTALLGAAAIRKRVCTR
jgi:hypothetical protein